MKIQRLKNNKIQFLLTNLIIIRIKIKELKKIKFNFTL